MVDDPSSRPELFPTEEAQERERHRLFAIIEDLVKWESTTNEEVLDRARAEIRLSWRRICEDNAGHPRAQELFDPEKLPAFHDPFAGGGSLPLEAQRLGLEAHASDLNPVAVVIHKAMIEIPPKFAGKPPVNPESRTQDLGHRGVVNGTALSGTDGLAEGDGVGVSPGSYQLFTPSWRGAEGLAEDVRYYASGCVTRPRSGLGTCTRRSRSPMRWRRIAPTSQPTWAGS